MSVNSYKSLEEGVYLRTFYDKVFYNTKVVSKKKKNKYSQPTNNIIY